MNVEPLTVIPLLVTVVHVVSTPALTVDEYPVNLLDMAGNWLVSARVPEDAGMAMAVADDEPVMVDDFTVNVPAIVLLPEPLSSVFLGAPEDEVVISPPGA